MKRVVLLFLCLAGAALAATPDEAIKSALDNLYGSNFEASRETLTDYSANHPGDPLPDSIKAATYLFAELEQAGALKGNFLSDDRNVQHGAPYRPAESTGAALAHAVELTRRHAGAQLQSDPNNRNALLAMVIVTGVQRDYLAMVEHKLRDSYTFIRESNLYAKRLLAADPTAYDAYLTKGFTEYLVANLPFYLRWMMSTQEITGTREQGLSDLEIAAQSGEYLKPFAQLLLAMFYLREKRTDKTEQLLAQLTMEYPANKTFRIEYDKLRASSQRER